jgi:hypothetical protein
MDAGDVALPDCSRASPPRAPRERRLRRSGSSTSTGRPARAPARRAAAPPLRWRALQRPRLPERSRSSGAPTRPSLRRRSASEDYDLWTRLLEVRKDQSTRRCLTGSIPRRPASRDQLRSGSRSVDRSSRPWPRAGQASRRPRGGLRPSAAKAGVDDFAASSSGSRYGPLPGRRLRPHGPGAGRTPRVGRRRRPSRHAARAAARSRASPARRPAACAARRGREAHRGRGLARELRGAAGLRSAVRATRTETLLDRVALGSRPDKSSAAGTVAGRVARGAAHRRCSRSACPRGGSCTTTTRSRPGSSERSAPATRCRRDRLGVRRAGRVVPCPCPASSSSHDEGPPGLAASREGAVV